MEELDALAKPFEDNRAHLRAVAYRMLGSESEAEDAVQEAWLRLHRADAGAIENLGGWLTTVVARVCLDVLRARKSRREDALGPEAVVSGEGPAGPEHERQLADSVGLALMVVLETLAPAERVAFVLHDLFDLPFEEIAPILGRSPVATRQLASRARRRVQGAETPDADPASQRDVVHAFLAAARGGDLQALLAVLDPEVVVRADPAAARLGVPSEVHGAEAVAATFFGKAAAARPVLVDGVMGAMWAPRDRLRVVFGFAISGGKIVEIELLGDPELIRTFELTIVDR